ncbi:sterol desaturase family protein [Dokdonella sp.]|uniref:sterol desaturase family protein n=1 Tax=Dokdonella sp. TaxID=2291710 RepID=UPI003C4774D1
MSNWLLEHAGAVRFLLVGSVLVTLLAIQHWLPRRGESGIPWRRARNIGLALIAAAIIYLILPLTAVGFSMLVEDSELGFFNIVHLPSAAELVIGVVILDLAIYWQHRWMHRLPWLWRLHRVHHSDTQFDATLGLRFHPLEIILSLLYKCLVIGLLGAAPLTVLVYEILLAVFSLFSHADMAIPDRWDRRLRRLVITPDWHRVHHSVHRVETDSNYGNFLSLWDRLFASATEQPRDGHTAMRIGLFEFRDAASQSLRALLANPLARSEHPPRPTKDSDHA